jgi:hypothetical protein
VPDTNRRRWGVQAPYFFLSYARTPPTDGDTEHPDRNLVRFYQTLCRHIMQLTDLQEGIAPGYLDRRTRIGTAWETEVKRELATCQVLVPVYSPRFVNSVWCGKEWEAFERRQQAQRDRGTFTGNAIVPAVWVPLDNGQLPTVLSAVQYRHEDMGHPYDREGLYALMARKRNGPYAEATLAIARSIVKVAQSSRLEPCTPELFDKLGNSFDDDAQGAEASDADTSEGDTEEKGDALC